jgi:hypothetical protein
MPLSWRSLDAISRMRRLARRTACLRASVAAVSFSHGPRSRRAESSSMAMALATSPARWPPMPSATAATGCWLR